MKANRESIQEAGLNIFNSVMEVILDGDARSKFISDSIGNTMAVVNGVRENLSAGTGGERGEKLIAAAAVSFSLLVFTRNNGIFMRILDFGLTISATVLIAVGIAMVLNSLWELKENMSIFLVPASKGKIVNTGLYAKARHPMYGGIILFAFGWSFLFLHPHKIVFTLLLAVILVRVINFNNQ